MSSDSPHIDSLAEQALSRKPRQGRSLASYERMLEATKALMLENGSEDFTLQEVSDRGKVSIGSIYLRFESKERLLHAVIAQELLEVIRGESEMLDELVASSDDIETFMQGYIDQYSAFLEGRAQLLRTIMQRAAIDPLVSEPGKETARRSAAMSVEAILSYRDEIAGDRAEEKAHAVFQVVFATIARQFGLGTTPEAGDDKVWASTKRELALMALAYLRFSQ